MLNAASTARASPQSRQRHVVPFFTLRVVFSPQLAQLKVRFTHPMHPVFHVKRPG